MVRTTSILTGAFFFISILGFDMCSENNCSHETSVPVTALVTIATTLSVATQKREEEADDLDARAHVTPYVTNTYGVGMVANVKEVLNCFFVWQLSTP